MWKHFCVAAITHFRNNAKKHFAILENIDSWGWPKISIARDSSRQFLLPNTRTLTSTIDLKKLSFLHYKYCAYAYKYSQKREQLTLRKWHLACEENLPVLFYKSTTEKLGVAIHASAFGTIDAFFLRICNIFNLVALSRAFTFAIFYFFLFSISIQTMQM